MTAAERSDARRRADALTPDALAALIRRAMQRRGVESQMQLCALSGAGRTAVGHLFDCRHRVAPAVLALCALGLIREEP